MSEGPADSGPIEGETEPERIYREHRERIARGEKESFPELLRRHPRHRMQLEALDSLARASRRAPASEEQGRGGGTGGPTEEHRYLLARDARLGDYTILKGLGWGTFGEVYLARQESRPVREVALKVLVEGGPRFLERFEREAAALASLHHHNVATVLAAGRARAEPPGRELDYIAMEYIPGEPIVEYCDRLRLGIDERLVVFRKVCEAVHHAHQNDIIHRDLKPSNILVLTDDLGLPVPKVIDFGLVKARGRPPGAETRSGLVGTPAYMAPEAFLDGIGVGWQADVYSLGAVLYELLTGSRPLEFASCADFIRRIATDEPLRPSLRVLRGKADPAPARGTTRSRLIRILRGDIDTIVLKAVEKDPDRRYNTALDLADDIRRFFQREPIRPRQQRVLYRARMYVARHRARISIALALAVLVGLPAASLVQWRLEVRRLRLEAAAAAAAYEDLGGRLLRLYREWEAARKALPTWAPEWEREEELGLWRQLTDLVPRIQPAYDAALTALRRSIEDPPGEKARIGLQEMLNRIYAMQQTGIGAEPIPLADLEDPIPGRAGPADGPEAVRGTISLSSRPPGAEVHCFRYCERWGRLVPLPFDPVRGREDPARGICGRPLLVVREVMPPRRKDAESDPVPDFGPGDVLAAVGDREVRELKDLADALRPIGMGQVVRAKVVRASGKMEEVDWTPFPKHRTEWFRGGSARLTKGNGDLGDGRLLFPYAQLGVTFEANPLEFRKECLLGTTMAEGRIQVELPAGSYLLVLRKPDFAAARFPVVIPGTVAAADVRLVAEDDVPGKDDGSFVYIPEGKLATGGDPFVDQGFPPGERVVPGFFLGLEEVRAEEWLRFINDERVRPRIDPRTGEARLSPRLRDDPSVGRLLPPGQKPEEVQIQLAPSWEGKLLWTFEEGQWVNRPQFMPRRLAAHHISHLAALEFVEWKNETSGGRTKYRLPSDEEWERAARGVDRRRFVWGDYLVWSFCFSLAGNVSPTILYPGAIPSDESIFGVRDLCGTVREHTSGIPTDEDRQFRTCRGGSYNEESQVYFRLAARNGFKPYNYRADLGFRLAADLPPDPDARP